MSVTLNMLLILSALRMVKLVPTENPIDENISITKTDIFESIESYEKQFNKINVGLQDLMENLSNTSDKLYKRLANFKTTMLNDDIFKTKSELKENYDEHQCRNYGHQCLREECSSSFLSQENYEKSVDIFVALIFSDFNVKLMNLKYQIDDMFTEILRAKMYTYVKHKMNDTSEADQETLYNLETVKAETLSMAETLIDSIKHVNTDLQDFQKSLMNEVTEAKRKYGCCLKSFQFEVTGYWCNPRPSAMLSEAAHVPTTHAPTPGPHSDIFKLYG